jgi:hypothetical protein
VSVPFSIGGRLGSESEATANLEYEGHHQDAREMLTKATEKYPNILRTGSMEEKK